MGSNSRYLEEKKSQIILGEFLPSEVLPYVSNNEDRKTYKVGNDEYEVRMNSHRYFIFCASQKCAACGIIGTKMFLEKHPNDKSPHFNLYAVEEDDLVLMTKDHIQAKSFGGENRHSNYQTMCAICNNLKGNNNLTLEAIRELRITYNENKNKVSRKKLNALINTKREKLCLDRICHNIKKVKDKILVRSDLVIIKGKDCFVCMSVYEVDNGMKQIACIKKGSMLTPISLENNYIRVAFNETSFMLHYGYTEHG